MKSSRRSGKSSFTWVISTIILEGSTPPSEDLRDAGVRDKPNSTLKSFNPTLTYSTRVLSLKNKNNHEKKTVSYRIYELNDLTIGYSVEILDQYHLVAGTVYHNQSKSVAFFLKQGTSANRAIAQQDTLYPMNCRHYCKINRFHVKSYFKP